MHQTEKICLYKRALPNKVKFDYRFGCQAFRVFCFSYLNCINHFEVFGLQYLTESYCRRSVELIENLRIFGILNMSMVTENAGALVCVLNGPLCSWDKSLSGTLLKFNWPSSLKVSLLISFFNPNNSNNLKLLSFFHFFLVEENWQEDVAELSGPAFFPLDQFLAWGFSIHVSSFRST